MSENGLYLAKISFSHPDGLWCGLPFRQGGTLFWPFQGTGWYWSPEIEAARRHLGADVVVVHDLWVARCQCDCRSFDWVDALYQERRRIGSKTRGYPLKLGLNSLYGKMAQRCGRGPYHDPVSAGLITAITRKRDSMRVERGDGYLITYPPDLSILTESEGYKPADFDNLIEISGDVGNRAQVDENTLLEAMPDFLQFLPRE